MDDDCAALLVMYGSMIVLMTHIRKIRMMMMMYGYLILRRRRNRNNNKGGLSKKVTGPRRVWTNQEELVLINCLKELVARGYKCDNGFKSGYVSILEGMMLSHFPGSNLKGDPHINSKIHVWKKDYGSLSSMLMNGSGNGFNNLTFKVEATKEKWEAQIKKDPNARKIKDKSWPYYYDWVEIFGKDRACGDNVQSCTEAVKNIMNNDGLSEPSVGNDEVPESPPFSESSQPEISSYNLRESSSATNKSKGKKRKISEDDQDRFIEAIGVICDKSDSQIADMIVKIGHVAERIGAKYDDSTKRSVLYDTLSRFEFLSVEWKVRISKHLAKNPDEMELFFSYPDEAKVVMLKEIMNVLH